MKIERAVLHLSVLCGALVWILDSLSDSLLFHKGSFVNLLILDVPMSDVVNRLMAFLLFTAFGFMVSGFIVRLKKSGEKARREHELFIRHELKNLFVPIKGYADLLKLAASDKLDSAACGYIDRILDGANRVVSLVDSLKKLQDIESGTFEIERTEAPLEKFVHDAILELSPMASEGGVVVECDCRGCGLIGSFDHNLMPGVFHNLIKNSIEHVTACGNPDEKVVRITHYRENDTAVVKISNRGVPLPAEKIAAFFDKFNTDTGTKTHGTGLGTTYAYLVTAAHGGTISVESGGDRGTTVTVRLELHPEYE